MKRCAKGFQNADLRGGEANARQSPLAPRPVLSPQRKGLKARYSEVMIQFKCPARLMFPLPKDEVLQCNRIKLVIQPNESIHLSFGDEST